jgi:hypothetical protein
MHHGYQTLGWATQTAMAQVKKDFVHHRTPLIRITVLLKLAINFVQSPTSKNTAIRHNTYHLCKYR